MNQSTSISPWTILGLLPTTKKIVVLAISFMAFFNVIDFWIYNHNQDLFNQWLEDSEPAVRLMSQAVWAVERVSLEMQKLNFENRTAIVTNIISIDWLIYLAAISCVTLSVIFDVSADGSHFKKDIKNAIRISGNSISTVIFIYCIVSAIFFLMNYTGGAYYIPFKLYRNDFELMFSLIYFYYSLTCPAALLAVSLVFVFSTN